MRFFQAATPPILSQPWFQQYLEQLDRFALARCALEVFFGAGGGAGAPKAAFTAYATFAQRTWEKLTIWSFKQIGQAAGDPCVSADQLWQGLQRADVPAASIKHLHDLDRALASLPAEPVAILARRMLNPADRITLGEVARFAQAALPAPTPSRSSSPQRGSIPSEQPVTPQGPTRRRTTPLVLTPSEGAYTPKSDVVPNRKLDNFSAFFRNAQNTPLQPQPLLSRQPESRDTMRETASQRRATPPAASQRSASFPAASQRCASPPAARPRPPIREDDIIFTAATASASVLLCSIQ